MGVAITFLEHERQRQSIDMVRKHKNATLTDGDRTITQDNVASFADENERKLQILTEEMKRRGFSTAAGEYTVQDYVAEKADKSLPACFSPNDPLGPVTILQDGSTIEFRDAAGRLSGYGVIVESSIAVVPGARDQVSPQVLMGILRTTGTTIRLGLRDMSRMVLNPKAGPSVCTIGILTKVETNGQPNAH
jgi:hypothetical protein